METYEHIDRDTITKALVQTALVMVRNECSDSVCDSKQYYGYGSSDLQGPLSR